MVDAWAGDAIIHLQIARTTLEGWPLAFTAGGPVATTSVLWSGILTALMAAGGHNTAVWGGKLLCVLSWLVLVGLTWRRYGRVAAVLLALHPGTAQNSLNGMEAGLFGCLVLGWLETGSPVIGCAMTLCRPEGAVVWLVTRPGSWKGPAVGCGLAAALHLWVGGSLVPASGVARVAAAMREAWITWPVLFHPKLVIRLAAYWPLTLCCILEARRDEPEGRLLAAIACIYTFASGAAHLARYCVPWMPAYLGLAARRLPAVALLWLVPVWGWEYHARVSQGLGYSHAEVLAIPGNRAAATDNMLRILGGLPRARIAATEAQARFFWDDRIEVLSLDGRTDGLILPYTDGSGRRDVARFLRDHGPVDWFEAGQLLEEERP